jgi:hypothetical protein
VLTIPACKSSACSSSATDVTGQALQTPVVSTIVRLPPMPSYNATGRGALSRLRSVTQALAVPCAVDGNEPSFDLGTPRNRAPAALVPLSKTLLFGACSLRRVRLSLTHQHLRSWQRAGNVAGGGDRRISGRDGPDFHVRCRAAPRAHSDAACKLRSTLSTNNFLCTAVGVSCVIAVGGETIAVVPGTPLTHPSPAGHRCQRGDQWVRIRAACCVRGLLDARVYREPRLCAVRADSHRQRPGDLRCRGSLAVLRVPMLDDSTHCAQHSRNATGWRLKTASLWPTVLGVPPNAVMPVAVTFLGSGTDYAVAWQDQNGVTAFTTTAMLTVFNATQGSQMNVSLMRYAGRTGGAGGPAPRSLTSRSASGSSTNSRYTGCAARSRRTCSHLLSEGACRPVVYDSSLDTLFVAGVGYDPEFTTVQLWLSAVWAWQACAKSR